MKKRLLMLGLVLSLGVLTACLPQTEPIPQEGSATITSITESTSELATESAFEAVSESESTAPIYLDVREAEEWAEGHVVGALHIPLSHVLNGEISAIPQDQPVHVYCRSGRRSGLAVEALQQAGYTNVINAGRFSQLENVETATGLAGSYGYQN